MKYIDIPIKDIIISDEFRYSKPSKQKLKERMDSYLYGDLFLLYDITVDQNHVLVDGYITYLTLLNAGYNGSVYAKVHKRQKKTYIFGKHSPKGKEYVWKLPWSLTDIYIPIGSKVIANTKYGPQEVIVTKVKELTKSPVNCKVKTLAKWW